MRKPDRIGVLPSVTAGASDGWPNRGFQRGKNCGSKSSSRWKSTSSGDAYTGEKLVTATVHVLSRTVLALDLSPRYTVSSVDCLASTVLNIGSSPFNDADLLGGTCANLLKVV
jgi:hypothetical protein